MTAPFRRSVPATADFRPPDTPGPGAPASVNVSSSRFLPCGDLRRAGHSSKNGRVELADIAARAAGENFPVGSVLFPRQLRPHIRSLYCYARLVDELGDAYDGDRLAALDELERQVELTFDGDPSWRVLRNVQATVRKFGLPREPFLRLIEANRMDQRIAEYQTWA